MTAEYQIWVEAGKREYERVKCIHAKAKAEGKSSVAQYSSERAAKPWSWSKVGPGALFDLDNQMILSVQHFCYDLNDQGFLSYLREAAQLHLCRANGSVYWKLLDAQSVSYEQFCGEEDICFAQEFEGKRYKYSDSELQGFWRIFIRTRVYLQGAYDAYLGREAETLDHARMASGS